MNYILWDINGVFDPFMAADLVERNFERFNQGWISWDLDPVNHGAWLREIKPIANFVWASSWEEESNVLVDWFQLGEEDFPHIPLALTTHKGTWKLASIQKWVEHNTTPLDKVVWVDDELESDAFAWSEERGNALLIKTDPAVGLTRNEFDKIKQFL